ncbi:MAG TPA: hypothetical protein VE133_14360 [Candidatus Sulfotelmatobacter sp.]|nr:hypothetical protein [Candidatus Sulfotelmatobacter sp.]
MANTVTDPAAKKETVYGGPALGSGPTVYNGPAPSPASQGTVYGGPGTTGSVYNGLANSRTVAQRPATATPNIVIAKGANIFFVIAAFSAINTLLIMFGSPMVSGMGLTVSKVSNPDQMAAVILLNGLAIGIFVLLGIFARQGSKAAFIIGMLLYGADTGLLLLGDPSRHIPGIVVHAFLLVGLFKAFSQLQD